MKNNDYDLIVIGAGPAGEKGAAQAAYFDKKVAVIEKSSEVGGAIMNTGVTGKGLRETSLYINGFNMRDLYGIDLTYKQKINVKDILPRSETIRKTMVNRVRENLIMHKIDLFKGVASFKDPHSIIIHDESGNYTQLSGGKFLIATGSQPLRPKTFPLQAPNVFDSDTILQMKEIPQRLLIVGNGTIGCEYACTFTQLGVRVILVGAVEELFSFADEEIIGVLKKIMERQGIEFLMPEQVIEMKAETNKVKVKLASGNSLSAEAALIAVGRQSNTQSLELEKIGISTTDKGVIPVNKHFQTSIPHIYAAGDVIGFPALCSTSMEQARMAMVHAFDLKYKSEMARILPFGIWTIPEVAMIGSTEKVLQEKEIPYVVGKTYYSDNPRGATIGEKNGMLKLLFSRPDGHLLGVHIIGEQACELISIGMMVINARGGISTFIDACFSFPSLSDMYKYATYDAMHQLAQKL